MPVFWETCNPMASDSLAASLGILQQYRVRGTQLPMRWRPSARPALSTLAGFRSRNTWDVAAVPHVRLCR